MHVVPPQGVHERLWASPGDLRNPQAPRGSGVTDPDGDATSTGDDVVARKIPDPRRNQRRRPLEPLRVPRDLPRQQQVVDLEDRRPARLSHRPQQHRRVFASRWAAKRPASAARGRGRGAAGCRSPTLEEGERSSGVANSHMNGPRWPSGQVWMTSLNSASTRSQAVLSLCETSSASGVPMAVNRPWPLVKHCMPGDGGR